MNFCRYTAYGLAIDSELPFEELAPSAHAEASLVIRRGVVEQASPPTEGVGSWIEVRPTAAEALCTYAGVGRFLVRRGCEILVDVEPSTDAALVRHALLGPVMAPALWQRGAFTLHASVLAIHGRAVAFVGESGAGKSTVAGAVYAAGHTLVSDDLAAIPWRDEPVCVLPGFPRLRMFQDTLRGLGEDPSAHPVVHALLPEKRSKHAERFADVPVPLARIYVLRAAEAVGSTLLSKQQAMIELMRHSYAAYQLAPLVGFARHMEMAAQVARSVPVHYLERPRDFARLPELVRYVERHVTD
jgi:hypothetical protein